jgi:hypothetical protein
MQRRQRAQLASARSGCVARRASRQPRWRLRRLMLRAVPLALPHTGRAPAAAVASTKKSAASGSDATSAPDFARDAAVATASSTALASMPRHALRPLRDLPMARKVPLSAAPLPATRSERG